MITFDAVEVRYGDFTAIPNLNLTIEQGEFFTLLGPSGCGKTTALRTLAGLTRHTGGDILIEGRSVGDLPPEKRQVGMVFQNYALFPSMSVADNIAFGLTVRRTPAADVARLTKEAADLVELADTHLGKNLDELSGGQQQRVAIARALVLRPKILLLDEPLSNLDAKLRQQMRSQLKSLQHEVGITSVYVTHDQDEALALSDRIAVFNKGVVEQVGTPEEIYEASATEFVCTFVGDASRLGPELVRHLARGRARLDPDAANHLREERARLTEVRGASALPGVVAQRSFQGTHSDYLVDVLDSRLRVMELGTRRLEPGDEVTVWIDPHDVLSYPRGADVA